MTTKPEEKRTRAATLVALYADMLATADKEIEPLRVLEAAREALLEAKTLPEGLIWDKEDDRPGLVAVVAGRLLRVFDVDASEKYFNASRAFAEYFVNEIYVSLGREAGNFAPGSRQFDLFRQAFLYAASKEFVTVTQLAVSFVEAVGGNVHTTRQLIKADIAAGRLQARKLGKQYVIEPQDVAAWLANPARGSRKSDD